MKGKSQLIFEDLFQLIYKKNFISFIVHEKIEVINKALFLCVYKITPLPPPKKIHTIYFSSLLRRGGGASNALPPTAQRDWVKNQINSAALYS